jgi:hypothetical protein
MLVSACRGAGKARVIQALTPAPADLPPLRELVAGEPFWRYPAGTAGREGVAHLRVWTTTTDPPRASKTGHPAWPTG